MLLPIPHVGLGLGRLHLVANIVEYSGALTGVSVDKSSVYLECERGYKPLAGATLMECLLIHRLYPA